MERTALTRKLAALATAGMTAGGAPGNAWSCVLGVSASPGFNNLITYFCWAAGAGLALAGTCRLKKRLRNPGKPLAGGLVRLAFGVALFAVPFVQTAMQGSLDNRDLQKTQAARLVMDNSDELK